MPPATTGSTNRQAFTAEYLAADNSAPLLNTCIAFLCIDTLFICLLHASRYLGGEAKKANLYMVMLMTGCYLVCMGKISIGIRKLLSWCKPILPILIFSHFTSETKNKTKKVPT